MGLETLLDWSLAPSSAWAKRAKTFSFAQERVLLSLSLIETSLFLGKRLDGISIPSPYSRAQVSQANTQDRSLEMIS